GAPRPAGKPGSGDGRRLALAVCTRMAPESKTPAAVATGVPEPMRPTRSAAQAQPRDQVGIALLVLALEVVQQLAALRNHHQKATTRVVVLLVGLEMLGQRRDAR